MKYSHEEIDLLATILEAEIENEPVDPDRARDLASRLATLFPEIAQTMRRVAERHLAGKR